MIDRNHAYQPEGHALEGMQRMLSDGDMHTRWEYRLYYGGDIQAYYRNHGIRGEYAIEPETGLCVGLRTGWVIRDPEPAPDHPEPVQAEQGGLFDD